MNPEEKEILGLKYLERPTLNALLRLWFFEPWLRFVVLLLLVLVSAVALLPLRIWTVSPPGTKPDVKVSGLSLAQSWALKRRAAKQLTAGQYKDAMHTWKAAAAENPGDTGTVRNLLQALLQGEPAKQDLWVALYWSEWLLHLTQTNLSALELVTRVYEKYDLLSATRERLASLQDRLTPPLEAAFLKVVFNEGDVEIFASRWEIFQRQHPKILDSELALYHAAYLAGWGPPETAALGRQQLLAAKEELARGSLAHRLQLKVSRHLDDLAGYSDSLNFLEERGSTAFDSC